MKRSPPRRCPVTRFLLLALMGVALASRLAMGAVAPADPASGVGDALAKLRSVAIICDTRPDSAPPPTLPGHRNMPPGDLLLADQADNAHAVTSIPVLVPAHPALLRTMWSGAPAGTGPPPQWRAAAQARGPPALA